MEERATGALGWGVVRLYVLAAGGGLWCICAVALYIGEEAGKVMSDTWVGWWSSDRCEAI